MITYKRIKNQSLYQITYLKQEDVQAIEGNDIAVTSRQRDPNDTLMIKKENTSGFRLSKKV